MSTFTGLLFDLDGTLLDTTAQILSCFRHTYQKHLQQEIQLCDIFPFFGKPLPEAFKHFDDRMANMLMGSFLDHANEQKQALITLFPNVKEVLTTLSQTGVRLAVVTSKPGVVAQTELEYFQLAHLFTAIIGCEACCKHKPDPEPVEQGLKRLGLPPAACMMIGDSPADLVSGQLAGVKTAAVRWSRLPREEIAAVSPDYWLDSMKDLLTICNLSI